MSRDLLIREIKYRASYRGTLELDTVCRCLLSQLDTMSDADLAMVRNLLLESEGHLMDWLVEGKPVPSEWQPSVDFVRDIFKRKHEVKHAS